MKIITLIFCFLLLFSAKETKTERYLNKLIQHKQYNLATI